MKYPKLQNIDIAETMKQIVNLNTFEYQTDLRHDLDLIRKYLENNEDRRTFLWSCSVDGTTLLNERDLFVKNNGSSLTFGAAIQEQRETLTFLIEPDPLCRDKLTGQMTQFHPEEYLSYAKKTAVEANEVILSFESQSEQLLFSIKEYEREHNKIVSSYGKYDSRFFLVPNETALLTTMAMARAKIFGVAEPTNLQDYLQNLAENCELKYRNSSHEQQAEQLLQADYPENMEGEEDEYDR